MKTKALLLLLCLGLVACANHQNEVAKVTFGFNGSAFEYRGAGLPVQTWVPAGRHQQLRVFVEGDGRAYVTSTRPSTDPTPAEPVILRLAMADGSAYLGRPCQYVTADSCSAIEWTDRRFSKLALDSMSAALDQIKRGAGADTLELVGYSGGGAMALLLAANRTDVTSVQTIAGNVDPVFWASSKGHAPLKGSLDPLAFRDRLALIPQRHMVGAGDKVITRAVVASYVKNLPASGCVQVVSYSGDHWNGISEAWRRYGAPSPACGTR